MEAFDEMFRSVNEEVASVHDNVHERSQVANEDPRTPEFWARERVSDEHPRDNVEDIRTRRLYDINRVRYAEPAQGDLLGRLGNVGRRLQAPMQSTPEGDCRIPECQAALAQQLSSAIAIPNPPALTGKDDADARAHWGAVMESKYAVWPFQLQSMDMVFRSVLVGRALQQYGKIQRRQGEAPNQYAWRVIRTFACEPTVTGTEATDNLKQLYDRRIHKGESYDDFFFYLQKEIRKFNWEEAFSENLLLNLFIQNLPKNHRAILKAHHDITPDQALACANRMRDDQETENYERHYPQVATAASNAQSLEAIRQAVTISMEQQQKQQQDQIASLKDEITKLQVPVTPQKGKKSNGNKVASIQQPVCQICQGTNHTADRCWHRHEGPVNKPPGRSQQIKAQQGTASRDVCQLCDREGHVAKDCKSAVAKPCYNCDRVGHFARECTFPPRHQGQFANYSYGRGRGRPYGHRNFHNFQPRFQNFQGQYGLPFQPQWQQPVNQGYGPQQRIFQQQGFPRNPQFNYPPPPPAFPNNPEN